MRIAVLLDNVAALANVAGFISAAFQGIDNCSVVVTVSARVYMSFIADVVSNDCCEEHYGNEECLDDDFGGVEYEDVAEREKKIKMCQVLRLAVPAVPGYHDRALLQYRFPLNCRS